MKNKEKSRNIGIIVIEKSSKITIIKRKEMS